MPSQAPRSLAGVQLPVVFDVDEKGIVRKAEFPELLGYPEYQTRLNALLLQYEFQPARIGECWVPGSFDFVLVLPD